MQKGTKTLAIVLRLLPAIGGLVGDLIDATRTGSDGGKRVTAGERDQMIEDFFDDLRPIIIAELAKEA